MPQQLYLLADRLTYELSPDHNLFKNIRVSLFSGDRIAKSSRNGDKRGTGGIERMFILQLIHAMPVVWSCS